MNTFFFQQPDCPERAICASQNIVDKNNAFGPRALYDAAPAIVFSFGTDNAGFHIGKLREYSAYGQNSRNAAAGDGLGIEETTAQCPGKVFTDPPCPGAVRQRNAHIQNLGSLPSMLADNRRCRGCSNQCVIQ